MDDMRNILSSVFNEDDGKIEEAFLDYFKSGRSIKDVRLANKVAGDIGGLSKKETDLLTKIKNIIGKEEEFIDQYAPQAKKAAGGKKYAQNIIDFMSNKSKVENEKLMAFLDDNLEEVQDLQQDVAEVKGETEDQVEEPEKVGNPVDTDDDGTPDSITTPDGGVANLEDKDGDGKVDTVTPDAGEPEKVVDVEDNKIITVPVDEIEPETGEPAEDAPKSEFQFSDELEPLMPVEEPVSDEGDVTNVASEEEIEDALDTNETPDGIDPNWMQNTIGKLPQEKLPEFKKKIGEFIQDDKSIDKFVKDVAEESMKTYPKLNTDMKRNLRKAKEIVKFTLAEFLNDDFNSIEAIKSSKQKVLDSIKDLAKSKKYGSSEIHAKWYNDIIENTISHMQNIIDKNLEDITADDISSDNPEKIQESIKRIMFGNRKVTTISESYDKHRNELLVILENNQKERHKMSNKIKSFASQKEKLLDKLIELYNTYIEKLEKYVPKAKEKGTKQTLEKEITRLKKKIQNFFKMKNNVMEVSKKSEEAAEGKIDKKEVFKVASEEGKPKETPEETPEEGNKEVQAEVNKFEKEFVPKETITIGEIVSKLGRKKEEGPNWLEKLLKGQAPNKVSIQSTAREQLKKLFSNPSEKQNTFESKTRLNKVLKESFWGKELIKEKDKKPNTLFKQPSNINVFVWLPETEENYSIKDKIEVVKKKLKANKVKSVKNNKGKIISYKFFNNNTRIEDLTPEEVSNNFDELNDGDADGFRPEIGYVTKIDWSSGKAEVLLYKTKKPGVYEKTNKTKSYKLKLLKEIPSKYLGGIKGLRQWLNSPWRNIKNDVVSVIAGIKGIKSGYDKVTNALTDKNLYDVNQSLKMGESEVK